MKDRTIEAKDVEDSKEFLGGKTLSLKKCLDWGFNVPAFAAIPSYTCVDVYKDNNLAKEIADQAVQILSCDKYAVRSSAFIEDGNKQSYAGQFTTKLDVTKTELADAIVEVIAQANDFLHGDLESFSLIIQEFINPDYAGVAFTRNPQAGREMVIEYHSGVGESIVGGKTKPTTLRLYWNKVDETASDSLISANVIESFKKIERKSAFPQDIEWCIKDDRLYILQSRSITTISTQQYQEMLFLDKTLSVDDYFLFAKTEISEIAPRPTTFTLDLLNKIYSDDGPVARVYSKYKVKYTDTDYLAIIGNELYIDKEKEIKSLLPAYSYIDSNGDDPAFINLAKAPATLKNLYYLNKIKAGDCDEHFKNLKKAIETPPDKSKGFEQNVETFFDDYSLIFEVNLLAGISLKKLNYLLKNEAVDAVDILQAPGGFVDLSKYDVAKPINVKGNSLDISDESEFNAVLEIKDIQDEKVLTWWQSKSDIHKKILSPSINNAIIFDRLREFGRWLTVKNISAIRNSLLEVADQNDFSDNETVYFSLLGEALNSEISEKICTERKDAYEKYHDFHLPPLLSSKIVDKTVELLGVSAGKAEGILQSADFLEHNSEDGERYILYTDVLNPNLTKYFDRISGIISANGGMLSHLAILARENNLPVIVGCPLPNRLISLGDDIKIDGSTGEIQKNI